MTSTRYLDRWDELSKLVEQADRLAPHEVDLFCKNACADDPELYTLLSELIGAPEGAATRLKQSLAGVAADVMPEEDLVGTSVGPYHLDSILGRGGMGDVYLASRADGEFQKKVAVKIVRRRLPPEASGVLFRNELQVMANLNHPSIPTLVDSGQLDDGRPYFISDYVDGVPIDTYRAQHALSTEEHLELLRRIGVAVQHAHTNLVLHLDIKPANILVEPNGRPSLMDFGVARLMDDKSNEHRAFSPGYASPEQVRGERLTAASDVYSLGALMVFLLTGDAPFSAPSRTPSETILARRAEFVQSLAKADGLRTIDRDLRAIVQKAMAERPDQRYATVDALLQDLDNFLHHRPVTARPKSYRDQLGKYLRRNRVAAVVVVASFAALAAFGLREASLRRQAQEALQQAEAARNEAELAYQAAEREAETSRQVSSFLVNVFDVANPTETLGNTVTARELLDKASLRVSDDLAGQPLIAANMMHTMGRAYRGLGLYKPATPMFEEALSLSEEARSKDSAEHASLLQSLGTNYGDLGRHDDALASLLESLELHERSFGPEHKKVAANLVALGKEYGRVEAFDESERVFLRALSIHENLAEEDAEALAHNLHSLGHMFMNKEDRDRSLEVLQRSVNVATSLGDNHPLLAKSLASLAHVKVQHLDYEEAIAMAERAVAIWTKIGGTDYAPLGGAYRTIGIAHQDLGNFGEAEAAMLKSLEMREAVYGPMHPATAYTVSTMANFYTEERQFDKAEKMAKRAIEIGRHNYPEESSKVYNNILALAYSYVQSGQFDKAEDYTRAFIADWAKRDEYHYAPSTARWLLADIYAKTNRPADAEEYFAKAFAGSEVAGVASQVNREYLVNQYMDFLRSQGKDADVESLLKRLEPKGAADAKTTP